LPDEGLPLSPAPPPDVPVVSAEGLDGPDIPAPEPLPFMPEVSLDVPVPLVVPLLVVPSVEPLVEPSPLPLEVEPVPVLPVLLGVALLPLLPMLLPLEPVELQAARARAQPRVRIHFVMTSPPVEW
jgi:hypothetical protein